MTRLEYEIWIRYPEKTCEEIAEELGEPIEFVRAFVESDFVKDTIGGLKGNDDARDNASII